MATPDVPGFNPANQDELRDGCWAEAGNSMLLVLGVRPNQVYYKMYDMSTDPIVCFDDCMEPEEFKAFFSYDPAKAAKSHKAKDIGGTIRWTWHDKTLFPFERVIKKGATPGPKYASADDLLSAAERVRQHLLARGKKVFMSEVDEDEETKQTPRETKVSGKDVANWIANKLSGFLKGFD